MAYQTIADRLSTGKIILLDGGIGTEVLRRGVRWRQHGIEDAPEVIRQIHVDYINAGADVITSHTFNLTKRNFINFFRDEEHMAEIGAPGLETKARDLCHQAVDLAKDALEQTGKVGQIPIAGSVSTVNHPFRPDLSPDPDECYTHHRECVQVLTDGGVDFIFLEGMNNIAEMTSALRAAEESGLPVWVSLIPDHNGDLLSGESLSEAAALARGEGAVAVLLSGAPVEIISNSLPAIINGTPTGARPIIGKYNPPSWKPDFYPRFIKTEETPPERYAEIVSKWVDGGAQIIGGSSGTTPEHIAEVKRYLSERGSAK